jgi:hypothetical protein
MRKSLCFTIAAVFAAIGATSAHADAIYPMTFVTTAGDAPTSAMVDCDSAGCPNSISATIDWEGLTFTFSDATLTSGLEPGSDFAGNPNCDAAAGSSALVFQSLTTCSTYHGWSVDESSASWILSLDTGTPGLFAEATGVGTLDEGAVASGGSFIVATSTPEPGSGALMLTGVALLGLMMRKRRRLVQR